MAAPGRRQRGDRRQGHGDDGRQAAGHGDQAPARQPPHRAPLWRTRQAARRAMEANHTTIVGKFAPQMAVVMSVPPQRLVSNGVASENISTSGAPGAPLHLVGESTIPGLPAGTVGANGLFTDRTLPAGIYLFELQQPYGDNAICQSELSPPSARHQRSVQSACPRVRLHPFSNRTRLEDGYGIYTYATSASFRLDHYWPPGLKFSEDTSLSATERASAKSIRSYTGAVKITNSSRRTRPLRQPQDPRSWRPRRCPRRPPSCWHRPAARAPRSTCGSSTAARPAPACRPAPCSARRTCAVRVCQLLPVASVHVACAMDVHRGAGRLMSRLGRAGRALWSEKGWTMAIAKRARLKDAWRL